MAIRGTPRKTSPETEDQGELPMPTTLMPEQPTIERSATENYDREARNGRLHIILRENLEDQRMGYAQDVPRARQTKAGRHTTRI